MIVSDGVPVGWTPKGLQTAKNEWYSSMAQYVCNERVRCCIMRRTVYSTTEGAAEHWWVLQTREIRKPCGES